MPVYTAGYKIDPDGVHAEVFDFPGVLSCGADLAEARVMLADALTGMAEIHLEMGDPLPRPDPGRARPGFDMVEAVMVNRPQGDSRRMVILPERADGRRIIVRRSASHANIAALRRCERHLGR